MRQARAQANAESGAARAGQLYRLAYLLTAGDLRLAGNLVHETLGRLQGRRVRGWRAGDPDRHAQSVLTRTCLSRRRPGPAAQPAEAAPGVPDSPGAAGTPLLQALGRLPAGERAVAVLIYGQHWSVKDTAAALKTRPDDVRTRCARAVGRLRELLGEDPGEPGEPGDHGDHGEDGFEGFDGFEGRLGRALREIAAQAGAGPPGLAAAGAARGRVLLRRTALVSGIAVTGLVGILLAPWVIAAGTARHPAPVPAANPTSRADMIRTLESLLPEGEITDRLGRGLGEGFDPYAHVVYDDGRGPAAVDVAFVAWLEPGVQAELTIGCPGKDPLWFDSCVVSRLPDGSRLQLFKGYEYPDRRTAPRLWSASLLTPGGQYIRVSEWNSPANHGSALTRGEPPLSGEELKHVATAPAWRRVAGALLEDQNRRTPVEEPCRLPPPPVRTVLDTFVRLLPKGTEAVEKGIDDAYAVVDDGKGKSYVRIDVRHCAGDGEDLNTLYSGSERLPDGTMIARRQGPDGRSVTGHLTWTVDTLGGGSLRIVISASNMAGEDGAVTRPAPALTMQQLRAISLSPAWDPLRS